MVVLELRLDSKPVHRSHGDHEVMARTLASTSFWLATSLFVRSESPHLRLLALNALSTFAMIDNTRNRPRHCRGRFDRAVRVIE